MSWDALQTCTGKHSYTTYYATLANPASRLAKLKTGNALHSTSHSGTVAPLSPEAQDAAERKLQPKSFASFERRQRSSDQDHMRGPGMH